MTKHSKLEESGEVEKKVLDSDKSKISPLEKEVMHSHKKDVDEVKEVIEGLVSEIEPNKVYEKIEKKLKEKELDEKEAMALGFKADNYYSAKEREDEENELGDIEGFSGTHPSTGRSR